MHAAKKAWATVGVTAKSVVIAVPTALSCAELVKTRMSVASVVKAIADATVRNAASSHYRISEKVPQSAWGTFLVSGALSAMRRGWEV